MLGQQAKHHRRIDAVKTAVRISVALGLLALLFVHVTPAMALQPPPVPSSEKICGLGGPERPFHRAGRVGHRPRGG